MTADIVDAQIHMGPGGIDTVLAAMDALGIQGAVAGGSRQDGTVVHGRFPLPPGGTARPNMPRQRPPEPR